MAKTKLEAALEQLKAEPIEFEEVKEIKQARIVNEKCEISITEFLNRLQWCSGDLSIVDESIVIQKPCTGTIKISNHLVANGVYAKITIDLLDLSVKVWVLAPNDEVPNYIIIGLIGNRNLNIQEIEKYNEHKTSWFKRD